MSFQVIVTRDFNQMSQVAADFVMRDIARSLRQQPHYVLGLATGNTPTGLYRHLANAANTGWFDSDKLVSFNLDEYVGLPGENAQQRALNKESYTFFMIQELFGLLKRKFREANVPGGTLIEQSILESELKKNPADWIMQGRDWGKAFVIKKEAGSSYLQWIRRSILDAYADKIRAFGGIDLQIISTGERGHVGFHEAGVPFDDNEMLLIKLDENTLANAVMDGHFASQNECPQYAVSMGAALVFKARTVLLMASGERKADVLADALLMEPDCSIPISYGHYLARKGGRMIYVIDQVAAARIMNKKEEICRRGIELSNWSRQQEPKSAISSSL